MSVTLVYNNKKYTEDRKIFDRCYNIKNLLENFDESEDVEIDLNLHFNFFTKSELEEQKVGDTADPTEVLEYLLQYARDIATQDLPLYYGENGDKKHPDIDGGSANIYLKEPKDLTQYDKDWVNAKSMYFLWKLMIAGDTFGFFESTDVTCNRLSNCFRTTTVEFEPVWEETMMNIERHHELMEWLKKSTETI